MKKSILLMSALFFCGMTALAQEPLYKMKLTLQDGSKLAALTDEIDSMQLTTVKAAEVHVTERYKTSSSIGINIEAEASVTRVQAAIVAGSEKDPNINYTEYVQKHYSLYFYTFLFYHRILLFCIRQPQKKAQL